VDRAGRPAVGVPAGDPGHDGGRERGEKREEGEGNLFPCSPRAIAHGGGGSTGRQGRGGGARGAAALWSPGERGGGAVRLCWCGAASRGGRRPLL
jgi:hypothetical protein